MADHPWADPNLQRPCTDRGDPNWPAAYAVAQKYMDKLRYELAQADNDGGFWKFVAQPEQVACQWAWVIDGGKYGGSLIRALQSRGVFNAPGGTATPAAPQPSPSGVAAAQPAGGMTATGQLGQLGTLAQQNPMLMAVVAGVLIFALVRK